MLGLGIRNCSSVNPPQNPPQTPAPNPTLSLSENTSQLGYFPPSFTHGAPCLSERTSRNLEVDSRVSDTSSSNTQTQWCLRSNSSPQSSRPSSAQPLRRLLKGSSSCTPFASLSPPSSPSYLTRYHLPPFSLYLHTHTHTHIITCFGYCPVSEQEVEIFFLSFFVSLYFSRKESNFVTALIFFPKLSKTTFAEL